MMMREVEDCPVLPMGPQPLMISIGHHCAHIVLRSLVCACFAVAFVIASAARAQDAHRATRMSI